MSAPSVTWENARDRDPLGREGPPYQGASWASAGRAMM
jgi:hypothetical protein